MNKNAIVVAVVLLSGILLVTAVPVSYANQSQASLLEIIQQEILKIADAIIRIRDSIIAIQERQQAETEKEADVSVKDVVETIPEEEETDELEEVLLEGLTLERIDVPTKELAEGLVPLYRFSATAGETADEEFSSIEVSISYGDVTLKDISIHAFEDEFFETRVYTKSRVGWRDGLLLAGGETFELTLANDADAVIIPAGQTRYFELRGITSAENITSFIEISVNDLSVITLQ